MKFHWIISHQKWIALLLILVLIANPIFAGILVSSSEGMSIVSGNGINYIGGSGITATAADGLLANQANGITAPSNTGITATAADGFTYLGGNGITATAADGLGMGQASGITATAADNTFLIRDTNGTTYNVDSVFIHQPSGITATAADGLTASGVSGITATAADSRGIQYADGITATAADTLRIDQASGITATAADGTIFSIFPNGAVFSGVLNFTATAINDLNITGAENIALIGDQAVQESGLQSLDPELAITLNQLTDDKNVNCVIVFHRYPTAADYESLRQIGITGGTRYRALPMISTTATRNQLVQVSRLDSVRSIYGVRTLPTLGFPGFGQTGLERASADPDLANRNGGRRLTGSGVTVAVVDTGVDGLHPDLNGRIANNVMLVSTLGVPVPGVFGYPLSVENLPTTDPVSGHGTFVSGVIAGNGAASNRLYTGVAPGAKILGLSAGVLNLLFVLEAFDFLLTRGPSYGVRVVNCSFSANTLYDRHDPVNVATYMLTDRGINVVFSAGNSGPAMNTLNPYAMAPWVISVGSSDEAGRLSSFSSRGDFANRNARPTVIAPGENIVSLRAIGLSLTGTLGIALGSDLSTLSMQNLAAYTVGSGTSFSAPQVAGTIALMYQVNPSLTPRQVRDILKRSATPLPPYYQHEVGAGMLNAHAAILEAAFLQRRMGTFRAALDFGQTRFVRDPIRQFSGTAPALLGSYMGTLLVPQNALRGSVQIAWGPLLSTNDLALRLTAPNGASRPEVNQLNLPGLTGQFERDVVEMPMAGNWTVRVKNALLGLVGGLTAQPFFGALEVTRAEYAQMNDLGGLTSTARGEIYQNLRSFVMYPLGRNFRPNFTVSRSELASALVVGGRVSQYIAGQQRFTDVPDVPSRLIVESVQSASGGGLFPDAAPGGQFRPDQRASRLAAAIALVRAAGMRGEAEMQMGAALPVSDAGSIPAQWRGYVAVALSRGFIYPDGGAFRPNQDLKRIEMAHAMSMLFKYAID